MSAHTQPMVDRLAEQLTGFEDQLRVSETGAEVLGEIRESIGALLTMDMDNEDVVRRMLQERLEQGVLRKNSFRVAVSILDQTITDATSNRLRAANAPSASEPLIEQDEGGEATPEIDVPSLESTVILPKESFAKTRPSRGPRPGVVLNERFLLDKVISSGSIGTLYLAYDQQVDVVHRDEARVAVTILSPDIARNAQAVDTLQKISRRAGRLAHPHIVHFNALGRDNGVTYLAKEWIEGRSLADILDSNDARRIDRVAAFRIVRELSIALDYAHRCGVVHADLKPANIMIAQDGCARLIDSVTARAKLLRLRSSAGKTAASTSYASRQVLLGERLSAPDDVFALGCLLYRLLAGYRVFGPRNAADAYAADMRPQRPEGLDDAQWRALEKALCHDREGRYESVPDFMEALDGSDNASTSDRLLAGGTGKGKRQAVRWLVATVLAVVAVAGGGYYSGILPTGPADVAPLPEDAAGAAASNGVPRQTVLVSSSSPEQLPASQAPSREESPGSPSEQPANDNPEPSVALAEPTKDALPALPVNAVGFADEYVVVYESDSAVQIDITRYNPDQQSFSIGYFVNDISAKDGQDYFAPDSYTIKFGAGQGSARLLIPLVQDAVAEGDESFVIRLLENDIAPAVIEAQSIVVTIRDGSPQSP